MEAVKTSISPLDREVDFQLSLVDMDIGLQESKQITVESLFRACCGQCLPLGYPRTLA
jgi:hypothetical protein